MSTSATVIRKSSRIEACEAVSSGPRSVIRPARSSSDRGQHPGVLGDDVAHVALELLVVEPAQRVVEVGVGHVAERGHAQLSGGLLAAVAAGGVLAVDVPVGSTGVGDEQGQSGGLRVEAHRLRGQVAHVAEERVPGLPAEAGQLVHPAGGRTDGVVLHAAAQREQAVRPEVEAEVLVEGTHHGADQRGRGRQPSTRGHVGVHLDPQGRHVDTVVVEQPQRAEDVGRPVRCVAAVGQPARRHRHRTLRLRGDDGPALVGGVELRRAAHRQCHGQHEAVVVVGVLADHVDASGREPSTHGGPFTLRIPWHIQGMRCGCQTLSIASRPVT